MSFEGLRLTGSGGQGLVLAGIILAEAALLDGKNVLHSQSYGPEARGGSSKSEVIISDTEIYYPKVKDSDLMLALTQASLDKYINTLKSGGVLIMDKSIGKMTERTDITIFIVPILETAREVLGKPMVSNIVALGTINEITKIVSNKSLETAVCNRIPRGTEELNKAALKEGYNLILNHKEECLGDKCGSN